MGGSWHVRNKRKEKGKVGGKESKEWRMESREMSNEISEDEKQMI